MITSTLATSTNLTIPGTDAVFYATTTGLSSGVDQQTAITTIAFCNPATPNLTNESAGAVKINVWLARKGVGADTSTWRNLIVKELLIPAGETVFFNDERIILAGGDEIWVATDASLPNSIAITVSSLAV
jgi:hypothetical protein